MAETDPFLVSTDAELVTAIALSQGGGYGGPSYRLTLSRSGRATYVGNQSAKRFGRYRGVIDPDSFDALGRIVLDLAFADLEPEYARFAFDMGSTEIVLWRGRRRQRVVDHGTAPLEFKAVSRLINARADEVYWQPVRRRPGLVSAPRTEPFRFFVFRSSHRAGSPVLRLDAAESVDLWISHQMAPGWGWAEGWQPTPWPSRSLLLAGRQFIEIDPDEAERLRRPEP